jgi:tRNA G18 (ribose-2'-O)-methylase SpoU
MLRLADITTIDDPRAAVYRSLKRSPEHRQAGLFVVQGAKNVERLLESRCEIVSMLSTHDWFLRMHDKWQSRMEPIEGLLGDQELVDRIIGHRVYQGVIALAKIPKLWCLEEALEIAKEPNLIVAVDGLNNADNLGVVVRNCGAFGVDGLIVGETSCSPYLRRAVRNSMGAIFDLPVIEVKSLASSLEMLRNRGTRCIAAHAHSNCTDISELVLNENICVVLGNEGHGVSKEVLSQCDDLAQIPMSGNVDSLNVASASACLLYEVQRQRRMSFN